MSQGLRAEDFASHVGRTFTPKGQCHTLTLVSVDISELPGWDRGMQQPFTLILRGPRGDVLPEGLYDFALNDGPELTLYIMPIHTMARDVQDYQIVFN